MKQTVTCPYCNRLARFVDSRIVYGKSYGKMWLCSGWPECNAYVGVHQGTRKPLGRMANPELRKAKKAAHAAFDPLWTHNVNPSKSRKYAYAWLAKQLGISTDECHIGMFDVESCEQTCKVCETPPGFLEA